MDCGSAQTFKTTTGSKSVNWCLHIITMYSRILNLLNFKCGCVTTIYHFTALLPLRVYYMLASISNGYGTVTSSLGLGPNRTIAMLACQVVN